ncbi:Rad9-domain-containing protein [Ascodesmis nigricans]|uniref:Rad9-domain-containing protein n=1 Tax=Ascodesmis nigricans TaxID=341454 RepID=A0A4S2N3Q5_9PEZI|nr:Rad9-domain-containing protein [Ascodesmis nigricans]
MSAPTTLQFTLSPQSTQKVHEALVCLSKFSEFISLEARRNKLCLSALNSTKSAYGAVHLTANKFFDSYQYLSQNGNEEARFSCRLQAKALLSVFRQRYLDSKEKPNSIDRCEFQVDDDPSRPECRILVRLIYTHGVLKTYKLTYEDVDSMHAVFDRESADNNWTISSSLLKSYMEHFGPKAEQLDISSENGRAAFTSFTEKLIDGKEILKQPLQTSISLDTTDFEHFNVTSGTHVAISLKDFRAITLHADTLGEPVHADYSSPGRALQVHYGRDGMQCEFTLMTTPDTRGTQQHRAVVASAPQPRSRASTRQPSAAPSGYTAPRSSVSKQPTTSAVEQEGEEDYGLGMDMGIDMPPPPVPSQHISSQPQPLQPLLPKRPQSTHPPPRPPSPPLPNHASASKPLFLTYASSSSSSEHSGDEDELARGLEEFHDLVGWDTAGRAAGAPQVVAKDVELEEGALRGGRRRKTKRVVDDDEDEGNAGRKETMGTEGIAPTQTSLVKGLFD